MKLQIFTIKKFVRQALIRPAIKENTARVVAAHQSNVSLLWHVISVKLNIGKKITGLEIMTLNCEKI